MTMNDNGVSDIDLDDDAEVVTGYSSAPFELAELEGMLENDPENEMLLDIAAFKHYTSGALERALECYKILVRLNYEKPLYHFYPGTGSFNPAGLIDYHRSCGDRRCGSHYRGHVQL